jgi:maltokinase
MGVSISAAKAAYPALADKYDRLLERAQRLAHLDPSGKKIRIHGDLHLGQVLRSNNEWLIFDFEGEPARAFVQRREKHSPLKDVAGMLRSFSYAEAAVELKGGPVGDRVTPTRTAFLKGYFTGMKGCDLLPQSQEITDEVLSVLELEKCLYELRYEIKHRPDWVRIPLRTLMQEEARR